MVALSPDGRTLVYTGVRDGARQLYRRRLDQLDAVAIPGTEDAFQPVLSPDGAWVVFESGGTLRKVALDGGPAVTICEHPGGVDGGRGATWTSDDTIVFGSVLSGLWQVPGAGGEPRPFLELEEGEQEHRMPEMVPGGRAVLFTVVGGERDGQIVVHSLETGERRIMVEGTDPHVLPTGHLVFARDGSLWAAPFDHEQFDLSGEAVPVLEGVRPGIVIGAAAHAVFANTGSLVYVGGAQGANLETFVWVDRDGREEVVGLAPANYGLPRLSPDGGRVDQGRC